MIKIPAALNAQFDALLVRNKIPKKFHSHYLKWLRYYLDFCQRYRFSESNSQSLPNFIRKLKEKRQTDVQQKQANEVIHIYYELIRSKSSNNTSELPKHPPKPGGVCLVKGNWQAAYEQLSDEPRPGCGICLSLQDGLPHRSAQRQTRPACFDYWGRVGMLKNGELEWLPVG